MSAPDPLDAVRTILLNDADVAALVADRVGFEIPEGDGAVMSRKCIVLTAAGGPGSPGGGYQQYGKQRIDATCYGETLRDSRAVYLALYTALKTFQRAVVGGVLIHSISCVSKGANARHPDTQWPTCYSSWLVLAAEITAS